MSRRFRDIHLNSVNPFKGPNRLGLVTLIVFLFALVVSPLIGPTLGRPWRQAEIFGVAPDPTAVATLGVLLFARGKARWELVVLPAVWCVVSGATLLAMHAPDFWVTPLLGAVAVSLAVVKTRRRAAVSGSRRVVNI